MKKSLMLAMVAIAVCAMPLVKADERLQYGFKFGVVQNSFNPYPQVASQHFQSLDMNSRMGLLAEAFYDWQAFRKAPFFFFSFGTGYKMLGVKGNFVTDDTPEVTGSFRNYFHCMEFPVGVKFVGTRFAGRPFVGAGMQIDWIVADSEKLEITSPVGVTGIDADTRPPYHTKVNAGWYFNTGLEIPTKSYFYVFEFRFIQWGRDNFKPENSFYGREDQEFQITFGVKIR